MSNEFSNDNDVVAVETRRPDAHGQAAMLLVESLIHGLIGRSLISVAEAVEIVETAKEVKVETGAELGDTVETIQKSLDLLQAISDSLRFDIASK